MMKIIHLEYVKLKKFHTLKILFAAYMVIVPCWMLFMNWFFNANPQIKPIFTDQNLFTFPQVWSFTTYCASFFNILLCVIMVIITCNEIQYKTMRQNIIDGLTKQQVILGKFVVVCFLSVMATLFTFLCALLIGFFTNGFAHFGENIHLVALYFLQTLGYFSFAFLFALIVRRSALAIVTFIVYFPVESIVGNMISSKFYQFFPLKVYADLTPVPFFKAFVKADEKVSGNSIWVMDMNEKVILACIFITLFFAISYFVLKRRDL